MLHKFVALDNGTMSNPYRFIEKNQVVDLTDAEAEFYIKSKWLRPQEEVRGRRVPPLMSHMANPSPTLAQVYRPQQSADISTPNYNANIAALQRKEAIEDGKIQLPQGTQLGESGEKPGGEPAQGTGNQDVI